jgi:maltooligosyltrehalose trehalohydrolase
LVITNYADRPLRKGARRAAGDRTVAAYRFGPIVEANRTTFRLWAPSVPHAEVIIDGRANVAMKRADDGFLIAEVERCGHGDRYKFKVADLTFPDLASRQQDGDTAGWSVVRAPFAPSERKTPLRPWHETVICEVHMGTATPEGTFAALADRLEHFRDAGYTALEMMPINEFPGSRNWGYDGTLIFAPEGAYGSPEDLRALIDRAHELGLCLILDVVYNHFGEVDNFVRHYAPEWFDPEVKTPWGPGINFNNEMVRQFYYENARMWLSEYDFDGLRFDSVHEMKSRQHDRFIGELAQACKAAKPNAKLIIENIENSFRWLERNDRNEPMTYTAQWNDDMHHVLTFLVAGEGNKTGYDDPSKDPIADFEKALADGFVHDPAEGEKSDGRTRGGPASRLPPDSFITYVENHDQIGNRADSKRLSDRIAPHRLDFCHFVKFLAPQIPLCFMGDEGNLRSPFPFFIELPPNAAEAKRRDRYKQMREIFKEEVADGGLPDPNDPATFERAKVRWNDYYNEQHRAALERFRMLARCRRQMVWPLAATPCQGVESARQGNCLIVNWTFEAGTLSMALNPTDVAMDIGCLICAAAISTGDYSQHGEVLRLGPWSAVAWVR